MPLGSVGLLPAKQDWVRTTFQSLNFSFILRGHGRYRWRGRWLDVEAPCVLTQFPGVPMAYGPVDSWEELFFIYRPEIYSRLRDVGFLHPDEPMWPLKLTPAYLEWLRLFVAQLTRPPGPAVADRLDRLAQLMVLESRQVKGQQVKPEREVKMDQVAQAILSDPRAEVDWENVSRTLGMHSATFRRAWARAGYDPPARFHTNARLNLACRLLAETELQVSEIADQVGYGDPLHFSRRFKQREGISPRGYREQHRISRGIQK